RRVEARLLPQYRGEAPAGSDFARDAKNDRVFQRLVTRTWPTTSAAALVRRVLGNRRAAATAADGLFDRDELALLHRQPARRLDDERWTAADIPLLDEADALVGGVRATYGHVVVDEAQDLSAMALRMVARRSPSGSITVLGDLAQATAPGAQSSWEEVAAALAAPAESTAAALAAPAESTAAALAAPAESTAAALAAPGHAIAELEIGYRVPAPILDLASRLLPLAAPQLAPSRSIRTVGDDPWITRVAPPDDLLAELVRRVG